MDTESFTRTEFFSSQVCSVFEQGSLQCTKGYSGCPGSPTQGNHSRACSNGESKALRLDAKSQQCRESTLVLSALFLDFYQSSIAHTLVCVPPST